MALLVNITFLYIFLIPVLCRFNHFYPEEVKQFYSEPLNNVSSDFTAYLLPKNLTPTWYSLTLQPFLNSRTFKGLAVITFNVTEESNQIVIHGNNNSIRQDTLNASVSSTIQQVNVMFSVDAVHEFFIFTLNETLQKQDAVNITIQYEGVLGTDMLGFYISTYNTTDANHSMAITQFESTYARRAFPCFDEPAYRAQFLIKILRPANLSSFSNMPLDTSVNDSATGWILDTYKTTPPMPTYLVAFGVSDLANRTDNKTFTVFARAAVIQDSSYLISKGQAILDKIGAFVGVQYPLPKMDVVAVPDFDAGAMENWGLTTYREKYVLYNPSKNTKRDLFGVLSVVAHEFGHQWFGDLVTPQWWDFSWLNEAFATYFEYTTSDQIAPEWGMGSNMYVMEAVQYALDADIGSPRPMTASVYTPKQIDNLFDYVIYEKGGSVLRMAENFLTTPIWQAGLKQYLQDNANNTGTPNKLFTALQGAATSTGLTNVNETLQGWTMQPGYPLITITQTTSTNCISVYNITQAPYAQGVNASQTWNVPLTYTTQSKPMFDASNANLHWLLPSMANTSVLSVHGSGWIIFNVDQVGFYRVNYDSQNWQKLKAQLDSNFSVIGSINRAQLLDDAFHLAQTGQLDYATAFGLTDYLPAETAVAPWNAFFSNMKFLLNQFYNTSTGDGLKKYAQSVMTTPFRALTANLTKSLSTFTGSLTVQYAGLFSCQVGLSECQSFAKQVFADWRKNISSYMIVAEVKQTVLCTGLSLDTSFGAFMDVLDYYLNSNNAAEKLTVMNALGCLSNDIAINTYLNVVCDVDSNFVRMQDRWIAFRSLASHQNGISATLKYITDNFEKVNNALGPRISTVISTIGNTITLQAHIDQVHGIINNTCVDQRFRSMLNSTVLPAVAKRQAWLTSKQGAAVKSWVDNYVKSSASSAAVNILLMLVTAIFVFNQ